MPKCQLAPVPKCLGAELSWCRSVRKAFIQNNTEIITFINCGKSRPETETAKKYCRRVDIRQTAAKCSGWQFKPYGAYPNPRGGADQKYSLNPRGESYGSRILEAIAWPRINSGRLGSTRGKLYKTRIKLCRHLYRPIQRGSHWVTSLFDLGRVAPTILKFKYMLNHHT